MTMLVAFAPFASSRKLRAILALLGCGAGMASVQATDWLQFGMDAAHSGYNAAEQGYSTANGNKFTVAGLTHPIDSAPIYVGGVSTPSGTKDMLFIVAKDGTLLALSARDGSVIWSNTPATSSTLSTAGSPAVDPQRQYVYAYAVDGKVHKYNIADGLEVLTGGWPEVSTAKPDVEQGASGLTIATAGDAQTYLYSVITSHYDLGDYQGHLTAINLASGAQKVFNAQCSELNVHFVNAGITTGTGQSDCVQISNPQGNSGIWGRAGAVYDALTDRVYVATGNGLFDPTDVGGNGRYWGDSVLALNPDGSGSDIAGTPVDSYTPSTYAALQAADADLGSTSPAILPAPAGSNIGHLGLQGGKDGCVRLLNLDMLSGSPGAGHVGGELQAVDLPGATHCVDGANLNTFKTQPAIWVNPVDASTWAFVSHNAGIVAYRVGVDESGNPTLSQQWSTSNAGTSPVVANGTLYYVSSGIVRALNATSGMTIWNDHSVGTIHWQSPIVVNGRLYVIDNGANLLIYRLDGIFRSRFD
jgi:hypothetical protein